MNHIKCLGTVKLCRETLDPAVVATWNTPSTQTKEKQPSPIVFVLSQVNTCYHKKNSAQEKQKIYI